jgi:Ca-activated chloride channel family protein
MEKTRFDSTEFRRRKEEFWPLAMLAVLFIALEWLLRNTLMRSIP